MSGYRAVYRPTVAMRRYGQSFRPYSSRVSSSLAHQTTLLGNMALKMCPSATIATSEPADGDQEQRFYQQHPDRIHWVTEQSHEILAGAKTVILPSNLFPDTVTVDRMKVTITEWTFFWSRRVVTLRIEDILNVAANLGLLFGSLTISSRVMNSTDHYEINGFWNNDAIRLKHIIQGYMIALHQGIDVSTLSAERLVRKLAELGNDPMVVK